MRRQRSLRTILFVAFLPIVIMPLLLVGAVTSWRYASELRVIERNIQEDLIRVAVVREKLLAALIENVEDSVVTVAVLWPDLRSQPRPDDELERLSSQLRGFTRFWVVAPDGRIRFSSDPSVLGRSLQEEPYWQAFRQGRASTLSDLVREPDGKRVVRIVSPIPGGEALVATYDTSRLQAAYRDPMSITQNRLTFIVDRAGRVVAHPDQRLVEQSRDLSGLPPVRLALRGERGTMVFQDPISGQERSAAYLPMSKVGWALVTIQPSASTMLVPLTASHRDTIAIFGLALGFAVLASGVLSRLLASPVERLSTEIHRLGQEGLRPDGADSLALVASNVAEYEQVRLNAKALYEALAFNIAKLEAKTRELTLTNQEQVAMVDALKRLDQLRGDFLNALSHDLRIPLTSIMGYAELLQDVQGVSLGPDGQEFVSGMLLACKRMQDMLEELLDYARMEVGRIKLAVEPLDPRPIVEETVTFFEQLAAQKGLTLSAWVSDDLPEVLVDPERLRQILNNLLSNAVKYTPPGGDIRLRVRTSGDEATFEVRDTGIGLSAEEQSHLFEKFYRSPRREVQQEKGSGLGLSLIKGVVEAHGGRIWFESRLNKGSTFFFTLPTRKREPLPAEAAGRGVSSA